MLPPVSSAAEDASPTAATPPSSEVPMTSEPDTFSFVDVEHGMIHDVEHDTAIAGWDGFL
jgi:hypothetical protein